MSDFVSALGQGWRGQWIWDHAPEASVWWRHAPLEPHTALLRRDIEITQLPATLPARATCDARYILYLNGKVVGRGPVRGEPEHLGWDEYDLADGLRVGRNVLVAVCRYYGQPGPWWIPAAPLGTLGRGSFCFETSSTDGIDIVTDERWLARPGPWLSAGAGGMHSFPPEVVDGGLVPHALHDADIDESDWSQAVVVSGHGHGTVLDRPPAAPYMSPLRRSIPQLTAVMLELDPILEAHVRATTVADPVATWQTVESAGDGNRHLTVWDLGRISLGYVHLRVETGGESAGATVDVVGGEDLRRDGLPEIEPRAWASRYIVGEAVEQTCTFFDPVGLRYLAAHHPPDIRVELEFEEALYPRAGGAAFDCSDSRFTERWNIGARTVDVCSTDAYLDCPGREQRAWVSDAYPQILVSLVTNPDHRLIRRHLELTSRSRFPGGLLAGAAGCDFARVGFTMPEYSLHWIRSLAAYWRYTGDDELVRDLLPVADAIIDRYEQQRGPSGLLEDFPGWVFIDWAQVDRDVVIGAHDALYAGALEDYATLPGASQVTDLRVRTAEAFEALWDADRHVYVDAVGRRGRSRRISQHVNGAALMAGIVPEQRVAGLIERVMDPGSSELGGRLVVTPTSADNRVEGRVPFFQYEPPDDFDEERDVVAAQPWFCRYLHEGLFRHGRVDLVLENLLRWKVVPGDGTFQEFWDATPGTSSRCHGWSSSPTFDLTTYVLGLRPAVPGYATALLDPHLGDLRYVSGRVPTVFGWLSAHVDHTSARVDVPEGMELALKGRTVGHGQHEIELEEST